MPQAQTSQTSPTASFLAVDFGNVHTRVVLVDVVEGHYRLVARGMSQTTLGYPFNDVAVGLERIIKGVDKRTGRHLLDETGELIIPQDSNRRGVDYFLATASAGRPLRAVVVGVLPDVSLASALRAIAGTYIEPVATFHIKDEIDEQTRLNMMLDSLPDLVFVTGGTDGGATEGIKAIVQTIKLAFQILDPTRRPLLLYAGNRDLVDWMRESFDGITTIFIADNIRPTMDSEALDAVLSRLAQAYEQHKEQHSAPYRAVSAISTAGIQPTAISYSLITEYLAKSLGHNVLFMDIGSANTTVVGAFNGDIDTSINTMMGLGHSAVSLIEQVGVDAVRAWLPFEISRLELRNYALNKTLRPAVVPMTARDTYIEHGLVRAALCHAIAQARPTWRGVPDAGLLPHIGTILVGGAALTQTGNPALTMQLVADIVQPIGITHIKADTHALIAALGAIARLNTAAVVQLLEGNNLDHLGTLISGTGSLREGKPAVKLKITTQDGEVYNHVINGGEMWLLPLPTGRELALDIRCMRGVHINRQRRIKRTFYGGAGGILFDMRGRPLAVGLDASQRADNMPAWLGQAIGEDIDAIPDEWLEPVEEYEDVTTITIHEEDDEDLREDIEVPATPTRKGRGKRKGEDKPKASAVADALGDDMDGEFARLIEDDDQADDKQADDELDDLRKLM